MILVFAARHADATIPALPAGYTSTAADGGVAALPGVGCAVRIGWRIASAAGTGSGVWTGANEIFVAVYRNVDQNAPVSDSDLLTGTAATSPHPGLTFSGRHLIVGGSKMDSGGTAPLRSEYTMRSERSATDVNGNRVVEARIGDTASATFGSWASQNVTKSSAFEHIFWAVALKGLSPHTNQSDPAAPATTTVDPAAGSLTVSSTAPPGSRPTAAASGSFEVS